MEQEDSYDGRADAIVWFRARTNCLRLMDRYRDVGGETDCFMSGEETEDLTHLILHCRELDRLRTGGTGLERPRLEDSRETVGQFLYGNEKKRSREVLYKLWCERERRRKIFEADS